MRTRLATMLVAAITIAAPLHADDDDTRAIRKTLEKKNAVQELKARGPLVLPDMFRVLAEKPLPEASKTRLLAAFAAFGSPAVLPVVRREIGESTEEPVRIAACAVLAVCADEASLRVLFTVGGDRPGWRVARALRAATTELLTRIPDAFRTIRRDWRRMPPRVRRAVLAAIGDAKDPAWLDFLADHLAFRPEHETTIINAIARLAPLATPTQADTATNLLRDRLDASNPSLCQAASLAVAGFQDRRSVPLLIELLASEAPGIQENAYWALRRISARSFPKRVEPWDEWYQAEEQWYDHEAPVLIARLESPDDEEVASALRRLAPRLLFRRELATTIAPTLWHESTRIGNLTCTTLAHLGSRAAVPALLEALEIEDVADAARDALETLTGEAPPAGDGDL